MSSPPPEPNIWASYRARMAGGPVHAQLLWVHADLSTKGMLGAPARWQEFYREMVNVHDLPTGRYVVYRYRRETRESGGIWLYVFDHQGVCHGR